MAASAQPAQPEPTTTAPTKPKPEPVKLNFDPKAAETMFSALTRRMNLWQQVVFNPTIDPAVRNRFYEELLFLYSAMLELSSDQPAPKPAAAATTAAPTTDAAPPPKPPASDPNALTESEWAELKKMKPQK